MFRRRTRDPLVDPARTPYPAPLHPWEQTARDEPAPVASTAPAARRRSTEIDPVIERLLRDVSNLRLTFDADLAVAAAAADEQAFDIVRDVVAGEQEELRSTTSRILARLSLAPLDSTGAEHKPEVDSRTPLPFLLGLPANPDVLPHSGEPRTAGRRRIVRMLVPAAPLLAGAAAALALLGGPIGSSAGRVSDQPVAQQLQQFGLLASSNPSSAQLIAAATKLHNSIAPLIAAAASDPAAAAQALQLLATEQSILQNDQPAGMGVVLAQVHLLTAHLEADVARMHGVVSSPSSAPSPDTEASRSTAATPSPAAPSPKASTSPSARPSAHSSSASSPSPSSSPSSPFILPSDPTHLVH